MFEKGKPVHGGHVNVRENDVGVELLDRLQGLVAVGSLLDFVSLTRQRADNSVPSGFLVVNDQGFRRTLQWRLALKQGRAATRHLDVAHRRGARILACRVAIRGDISPAAAPDQRRGTACRPRNTHVAHASQRAASRLFSTPGSLRLPRPSAGRLFGPDRRPFLPRFERVAQPKALAKNGTTKSLSSILQ